MGIERTHGRNYDLARVLAAIDTGHVVLPEFQRDFIWDSNAVSQLLATCLAGWPIGSLLILPGKANLFFKVREFEGAPAAGSVFELIVLDGQQRLTSLYQALYGIGRFKYVVSFRALGKNPTIEELEESIEAISAKAWARRFPSNRAVFDAGYVPVQVLKSATEFFAWRDAVVTDTHSADRERLTQTYVDILSGLDRYEIPAVVIDDTVHPEAVARIFERVNRLGQPLGTFDLMVAKSFQEGFNLRDRWDEAQAARPTLASFLRGDGLPVLGAIALHVRESVRQSDVLQLSGDAVRQHWSRSVDALQDAVDFLQGELGVWSFDWLPYRAQLLVLAGLSMSGRTLNGSEDIVTWFWSSTFGARYDAASNTRAIEDFRLLRENKFARVSETNLERETWRAVTKRQFGALHRGVTALLAASGPRDVFSGEEFLFLGNEQFAVPSMVSILPRGAEVFDSASQQLTLGMILASGVTSIGQSNLDLSSLSAPALASQYVPTKLSPTALEDFIDDRLDLLAQGLQGVSGNNVRVRNIDDDWHG